jgi:DNA helicase HerA-like ATPase
MTERSTTAVARARLVDRLQSVAAAWSVNGRDVRLTTNFDLSIEPGDLLIVTPPGGERLLVQLHELAAVTRQGITVELDPAGLGLGNADDSEPVDDFGIQRATVHLQARVMQGAGVVIGRLDGDGDIGAFDDATIEPADDDTVATYFDGIVGGGPGLEIGTLRSSTVPARLRPTGFARHTFMCGQSGSGKTFSLGVVLERLLNETDLPVIIVDPNSDYVNLGRLDSRTTCPTSPSPSRR